jgi:REP element-mobilizing transposase RayT
MFPQRKRLPHEVPSWVQEDAIFFITLNARERGGTSLLEQDRPARLWESAQAYARQSVWWPHLLLLMPDHLHMLASFARSSGPRIVLPKWKRWTARTLGIRWQRDFFDHRIRNAGEYQEKGLYIRQNPIRKGLVHASEAWPFVWEMRG